MEFFVVLVMLSIVALMIGMKYFNKGSFVYAIAGKVNGKNEDELPPEQADTKIDFNSESFELENKRTRVRNLYKTIVWGECMKPRGINDKDMAFFSKIKKADLQSLKEGELILLTKEVPYKGKSRLIYKIREFRNFYDNGRVRTTYYDDNGEIVFSNAHKPENERGHSADDIVGKLYAFYPM